MDKYLVTKFITKFGYYASIGIIIICAIAGFISGKFLGLIGGAFFGAFISIPAMMYCEIAYAMIRTEENTRAHRAHNGHEKHVA